MTARTDVKESLISYAIEKTLIEYGNSALEDVHHKLYASYGLGFMDCYHNPEHFRRALLETFGDSYIQIIELIKKRLGELATQREIVSFFSEIK
jgi:hypothetical protein